MKSKAFNLVLALILLTSASSFAYEEFLFPNHTDDPMYYWYVQDYPRWHYSADRVQGWTGIGDYHYLFYVQFDLHLLENTLNGQNVIHFQFLINTPEEIFEYYFDVNPGELNILKQFDLPYGEGDHEIYSMAELNTISEGGGYIIIDEDNSYIYRYTNSGVEPETLGRLKSIYK